MFKTIAIIAAVAALPASAAEFPVGSDPAGARFTTEVVGVAKVLRVGRSAIYCGIRSPLWYRSLETGLVMGIDGREQQLRAQASSPAAFSADVERVREWSGAYIVGRPPSRAECSDLIDSPELARADSLQRRATANYR